MAIEAEFQVVVLAAGKGSRMPDITSGKPKCLLPVGSKPLVWYPLMRLQQSGFTEVILIVNEAHKSEVQKSLDRPELKLKIDYCCAPDKDNVGTVDSLVDIHDKIKSDLIVVTCDLVTDLNLAHVVNLYRKHDATICSTFFKQPNVQDKTSIPGRKSKHNPERDLIAVDNQTGRLVFHASASDYETDVNLPRYLLQKHTSITMHSNLLDSHLYVMKKWVVDYLKSNSSFCTLKGELIPHIVMKQLVKPFKSSDDLGASEGLCAPSVSVKLHDDTKEMAIFAEEANRTNQLAREASAYNDHVGDLSPCYHDDKIRCYAYIAGPEVTGIRVNTLSAYWNITQNIISKWDAMCENVALVHVDPKATNGSTQIADTFLWESSDVAERTSLKNSLVGSNSCIAKYSRLLNSIVMNNVKIKEKVVLENCIVCDDAVIDSNCTLKNCIVGSKFKVSSGTQGECDAFTESGHLMEFE